MKLFSAILAIYLALLCATDLVQTGSVIKRSGFNEAMLAKLLDIERILGPCPSGWTRFKSFCYFVSSAVKSWQAARTYCKSKGGDLVKINSDEENEFVLNLVYKHAPSTKQVWIGLKWDAHLSKFVWADEALPKYTNWHGREPNGKGSEPCSNMWTGQAGGSSGYWNDLRCLDSRAPCGLVCKRLP